MFFPPQPLHFTGIGGIGMSGLAEVMQAFGCPVTGSDLKLSAVTERLVQLGIQVLEGHRAENVPAAASAVVATSAASADNPELQEARRRGLPIIQRGELLAELMRTRKGVAVAGSHGKTTTTSMLSAMAIAAQLDPLVLVGARLHALNGSNAWPGAGEWMVAESDESDGSFLELAPVIGIITNVDREHLDHYHTFDNVRSSFVRFMNRTAWYGAVIACADDPELSSLLAAARRRVVRYGRTEGTDFHIESESITREGGRFRISRHGADLGEFTLPALGSHNVLNAAAALAAALEMHIPLETAREALAQFRSPSRRMELRGNAGGVTIIDDYGHHPTEVKATLKALRLLKPERLYVLFQPHRYTRTQSLMNEFSGAFADADAVRIADIYAASEAPIAGVSGEALATKIADAGHTNCAYTGTLEESIQRVASELRPGDLVLTLGAGSVTGAGAKLIEILSGTSREGEHHG